MTVIKQDDLIQSVADALQFISYYHPVDFIQAWRALTRKSSRPPRATPSRRSLINSRMCAEGHRPICQDTGIVTVFLKVGMNVQWDATMSVEDMVNEGVRRAYLHQTTSCAPAYWPTPPVSARTPKTTRPPSST